LAEATKKHVAVALNGDGGDENFAGYVRYPILKFSLLWERCPSLLHTSVRSLVHLYHSLRRSTFGYRMQRFEDSMSLPWEQRYLQYISFFTEEEKRTLFMPEMHCSNQPTDVWYATHTREARTRARHPIERAMSMDIDTYLADDLMPKVDIGCMAHGLEARSPLLDHRLMELCARIPVRYKLHGYSTKWIFRQMLRGVLPEAILTKKKTGFRLPLDRWFRADLKEFICDRLLAPSSHLWQCFDRRALERFLANYFAGTVDYSDHIWTLLWLDEWLQMQR
jgi:asparagine synthase (glutamine-hydrolysing)